MKNPGRDILFDWKITLIVILGLVLLLMAMHEYNKLETPLQNGTQKLHN